MFLVILHFLNCKDHIAKFCNNYHPTASAKQFFKNNLLQKHYWKQFKHLHNHLEIFYKAIIIIKGKHTSLTDHFQTLNWLLFKLEKTKHKFIKLSKQSKKKTKMQNYCYLAICAKAAWQKYKKYCNWLPVLHQYSTNTPPYCFVHPLTRSPTQSLTRQLPSLPTPSLCIYTTWFP